MMENLAELLAGYRIGVLGQRVIDFWAVLTLIRPDLILVCEAGHESPLMAPDATVLSPERTDGHRRAWTNKSLGELAPLALEWLARPEVGSEKPLALLSYCSNLDWEDLVAKGKGSVRIIAAPAAIKERLDNKIYTREGLKALGLPVPKHLVVNSNSLDFELLAQCLGSPLFLQVPIGSAGIGTFEIKSADDLAELINVNPRGSILASAYAGPTTLNVHGLALPEGVHVSTPSVQLSGISELVATRAGYCGNDFSAINSLRTSVVDAARQLTRAVGVWLKGEGFIGLFGVDLAVEGEAVSILEVNPRLQGSTWLLSALEARDGVVPLVVKHFVHLLGGRIELPEQDGHSLSGAQGILHSLADVPQRISHRLQAAVYTLDSGGKLEFRRDGHWPLELLDGEVFIFGLPPPESVVEPGSVLVRFACESGLSSLDGRSLTHFGRKIVTALRQELAC